MGHEAAHVLDVGLLESSDSQILDYAIENGAVILTKDEDFAIRASVSKTPPLIVRIRIGNCPNARLPAWFEAELPSAIAALGSGTCLVEITG